MTTYVKHLCKVFEKRGKAGLKVNRKKGDFFKAHLQYLAIYCQEIISTV